MLTSLFNMLINYVNRNTLIVEPTSNNYFNYIATKVLNYYN